MVIVLNLGGEKTKHFTTNITNQYIITSFFHKVMGNDNSLHDSFSEYAVSEIQGGKLANNCINYIDGGFVHISSPSTTILDNILLNIYGHMNKEIYDNSGIYLRGISISDFTVGSRYDIIQTTSPIRLKNKDGKEITFKDEEFIHLLNEKMKAKLHKFDNDLNLNGFNLEVYKIENAKQKMISVKKGVYTKCSYMRFVVKGTMETRRIAYLLGLGQSTGCGFGSIKVL